MTDIEDRIRAELRAWAQEAPAPRPGSGSARHALAPASRPAAPRRWIAAVAAAVTLGALARETTTIRLGT